MIQVFIYNEDTNEMFIQYSNKLFVLFYDKKFIPYTFLNSEHPNKVCCHFRLWMLCALYAPCFP